MPAEEARAAKAANEAAIFARANVVGVGIGNKTTRGRETGEPCIVVFVEAKRPEDGGRLQDTIARLVDFVPIQFKEPQPGPIARFLARLFGPLLRAAGWGLKRLPSGRSNLVDAAVAEPIESRLVAPEILGIGRVRGTKEPDIGLRVRKSGRTTGVTAGRIPAIDAVVEVDYDGPTAIFREQIVSDLLSKGGDSGSLVVDEGRHAVGLRFAGGATTTLVNPIAAVAKSLDLVIE